MGFNIWSTLHFSLCSRCGIGRVNLGVGFRGKINVILGFLVPRKKLHNWKVYSCMGFNFKH